MYNKRSYQPVKGTAEESIANKRKGCGVGKRSKKYRSRVYNSQKDRYLAGPWENDACSEEEGILNAEYDALLPHTRYWRQCRRRVSREFLKNVGSRLEILTRLASGRRRG